MAFDQEAAALAAVTIAALLEGGPHAESITLKLLGKPSAFGRDSPSPAPTFGKVRPLTATYESKIASPAARISSLIAHDSQDIGE